MTKVVINVATGWFQLSEKASVLLGLDEMSVAYETDYERRAERNLVRVVEQLGTKEASGPMSQLIVVLVPDDTDWAIFTDDSGREFVYDKNRVWGLQVPKGRGRYHD